MSSEQDFNLRLLEVFRTEAREHRLAILSALRELETGTADAEHEADAVEKSFRAAHTLKGAARAVNKNDIVDLCHSLEGIFSVLKSRRVRLGKEMFGALYEAIEGIQKLETGNGDGDSTLNSRLKGLRGTLDG
jgi:two-component system, chemotaxis family, sensor kinase CheA